MKKWFRRSLKNQLIILILIVALIPIFLLGIFSYATTVQVSKERASISGEGAINQLHNSIDFMINDAENMSLFLIGNESIQRYLSEPGSPVLHRTNIYAFLSNLVFSKEYIDNILIMPLNNNQNISTTATMENIKYDFGDMPKEKWWTVKEVNQTLDGPREMIMLIRPIRSTNNYELLGYLSISLNQQVIEKYLNSVKLEWSESVFILNGNTVLAESNKGETVNLDVTRLSNEIKDRESGNSLVYKQDQEKTTVFVKEITSTNWDLVLSIPFNKYSSQNRYFFWLTIYSVALAVLLVTGLVIFFISKVFKPLTSLKNSIQDSRPGIDIKTIGSYSDNEIGELIKSYNELNHRVANLMAEVKRNESIKRKLDMQALQSQINPHFLYNTLASVHWIALRTNSQEISKVVSDLSDFLRFSLNKGNEYCTVEQEVGHLSRYLEIQKMRYPNAFKLHIHIPDEIKQHSILKLVLQPLVENSLIHGFFPLNNHDGVIHIQAKESNDHIYFTVMDNGAGINKDKLMQLRKQFSEGQEYEGVIDENYGIRNVNLRLILHYGKTSGLVIESDINKGTIVKFAIPINKDEV